MTMMGPCVVLCIVLLSAFVTAEDNIVVIRLQLLQEQEYTLVLNNSVEYIIDFSSTSEQSAYPTSVRLISDGGDIMHPTLITARQRTGAETWQLPYVIGDNVLFEIERTLCPANQKQSEDTECNPSESLTSQSFSLHVSSACAAGVALRVRAGPRRGWAAAGGDATLTAPALHYYRVPDDEDNVRLTIASDDDVCATVLVQNFSCPILYSRNSVSDTISMTIQRLGGVQLSRARYPNGFYVIVIVQPTDTECTGEEEEWEAAGGRQGELAPRAKQLTITVQRALTRTQYVIAMSVTLGVFTLFYILFFVLVFAQQWPPFAKYVSPRAPLLKELVETEVDNVPENPNAATSRRRLSNMTFDSEDSNSEEENTFDHRNAQQTVRDQNNESNSMQPTHDKDNDNTIQGHHNDDRLTTNGAAPVNESPDLGNINDIKEDSDAVINNVVSENNKDRSEDIDRAENNIDRIENNTDALESNIDRVENEGVTQNVNSVPRNGELNQTEQTNGNVPTVEFRMDNIESNNRNSEPPPFGLPRPRSLRVAVLARGGARARRARADRYLHTAITVAVFYALPVLQFVSAFQIFLNVSGNLDLCYYNFLCAHPLGGLSDFNHVFSNLGYLTLGALFMLQLRRRRLRRKKHPKKEEYGIPAHYGMLSTLGAAMMVVGLLSAGYHVCPNRLNFQFDTAFMYVLAVVSMVKIYQSRHPDVNARAHATFGVLALLMAMVVWGVLGGGAFFWAVFTVLHLFTFLMLSLRIYYLGQFKLERATLQRAARGLARGAAPLYLTRMVMLLIANAVNWAMAFYGLWNQQSDIAGHLLELLLVNTLLHMLFYLSMKLLNGERLRWYSWLYLAGALLAWIPALYFFVSGSSDWSATPALSRHMNHECLALHFYDAHDLWHLLSAVALFMSFNAMLTWDDGLSAVKATDIVVF